MAGIFSLIQHPNGRLFLMPVIVLSAIGMCGAKASEPEIEVEKSPSRKKNIQYTKYCSQRLNGREDTRSCRSKLDFSIC